MPKGVCFNKQLGRYKASITKQGKTLHLGYYKSPLLAHEAYLAARGYYLLEIAESLERSEESRSVNVVNSSNSSTDEELRLVLYKRALKDCGLVPSDLQKLKMIPSHEFTRDRDTGEMPKVYGGSSSSRRGRPIQSIPKFKLSAPQYGRPQKNLERSDEEKVVDTLDIQEFKPRWRNNLSVEETRKLELNAKKLLEMHWIDAVEEGYWDFDSL